MQCDRNILTIVGSKSGQVFHLMLECKAHSKQSSSNLIKPIYNDILLAYLNYPHPPHRHCTLLSCLYALLGIPN